MNFARLPTCCARLAERRLVVPRKTPITLKREVAEFLAGDNVGSHAFILDDRDVVLLLRAIIKREGSISAFAKRRPLAAAAHA
jgi:hypothetical protein